MDALVEQKDKLQKKLNDALKENEDLKEKQNANSRPNGGRKRKRKVSLETAHLDTEYSLDTSEEEF